MALPFLVTLLINTAISIGLSLIVAKLTAKKKSPNESAGAVIDIEYGETGPRRVAIGKCAVRGLAVYDNTFGAANSTYQRVLKLSDWYTTAMTRVAINGEWVTLGSEDAAKGYPVASGEYSGLIWVKFFDGRQTAADDYLIDNSNPTGRWTANHKGIAVSFAVVTFQYNQEKLSSIPEVLIEFTGAPLYDVRLDGTAGGTGTHRWNDVSTWEYSANPILADYCYRRGFYTGTWGSGADIFLGMGTPASELSYARYAAAADICDETVDSEPRYVVSILLGADKDHGDNIEDLMQACAGMVVESVSGSYPILGATQTPVATLTNDDVIVTEQREFRQYRPMDQVVNTVFGTYIEPDFVYSEIAYSEQTTGSAVTLDRRTLDFQLNFPMVPSKRQAEQLASIYFNENRFEVTKTVTVREKWQVLEVGDWITWQGDEDGADRDYQIVGLSILQYRGDNPRGVQLTLQERDSDIYAGIGTITPPTPPTRIAGPVYANELANFAVAAGSVVGDDIGQSPILLVSWDLPTDPTIESILLEWRPRDQVDAPIFSLTIPADRTIARLQEGIVAATIYEVRHRLIVVPYRATVASSWVEVTTGARVADFEVVAALAAEVREGLARMRSELRVLQRDVPAGIHEASLSSAQEAAFRRSLKAQQDGLSATVVQESEARIDGDAALASSITAVEAVSNAGTASGLVKLEASSAPDGVTARFGVYLRADTGDAYDSEAAEFLEILDGGGTRKTIIADNTVLAGTDGTIYGLFGGANGAFFDNARIANLTADNIAAGTITTTELDVENIQLGDTNITDGSVPYVTAVSSGAINSSDYQLTLVSEETENHDVVEIVLRMELGAPGAVTNAYQVQYRNAAGSWIPFAYYTMPQAGTSFFYTQTFVASISDLYAYTSGPQFRVVRTGGTSTFAIQSVVSVVKAYFET